LGSANGPSVALGLPPANCTRAALAGGCSPSSPSSTPALVKDSLYFVILATRSAGGTKSADAFSYAFGITSIMNRGIGLSPNGFRFGAGLALRLCLHDERGAPRSTRRVRPPGAFAGYR